MSRFFKCPYCNYWSYRKADLIRHISGVHGDSHAADGIEDLPLTTPHLDRYCAKCDIQFALYDNYQVHKEHYCNTRPVREYIELSSSPTPTQQFQQPQNQEHHPLALPNKPRYPGSNTTIVVTSESESRDFINSSSPTPTQQLQRPQNQEHHPIALPNQPRSPGSNTTIVVTSESESESRDFINSSSPTPTQQLQQPQNQEHHPIALPNQPRSPGSNTTIVVTSESESESIDFIKSTSSPTPTQQLKQQPQNQEHHPIVLPNQPRSPGSNNTIVVTSESESESESRGFINSTSTSVTSEFESGFNMGLNHPLYTAIATSALTLVPCSYAAAADGLLPGTGVTTPAGNMIIQNPSTTPESNSDSQGGNVIPTCTVMPETEVAEQNPVPSPVSGDDGVKEVAQLNLQGESRQAHSQ